MNWVRVQDATVAAPYGRTGSKALCSGGKDDCRAVWSCINYVELNAGCAATEENPAASGAAAGACGALVTRSNGSLRGGCPKVNRCFSASAASVAGILSNRVAAPSGARKRLLKRGRFPVWFDLFGFALYYTPQFCARCNPGRVPERSKGVDCKSTGEAFGGSNPPPTTIP